MHVDIATHPSDSFVVCRPIGELDTYSAVGFRTLAATIPSAESKVVFDLARLEFVDAAGLRALLDSARRINDGGGAAVLYRPSAHLARILALTGFDRLISVQSARSEPILDLVEAGSGAPVPAGAG